jgi:hypothetical protein
MAESDEEDHEAEDGQMEIEENEVMAEEVED